MLEKLLADSNGKTADDDVVEGGEQCVGIQVNRVIQGCHTLDVGFQCIDCWDELVSEFFGGLQQLV